VQQIYGPTKELDVIALEPELERLVTQALTSPHGAALDPGVADTLARSAAESAKRQEDLGHPACLLVPDLIRAPMARLLKRAAPRLKVLGHSEIPETHSIRIGSVIGAQHELQTLSPPAPPASADPGAPGLRRRRRRAVHQALPRRRGGAGHGPGEHAAARASRSSVPAHGAPRAPRPPAPCTGPARANAVRKGKGPHVRAASSPCLETSVEDDVKRCR
jgi:hypothetical protein